MSAHAHGGASEAHADHHYEYDGTPAEELGPDEPATPGWLTLLGISLVLAVMLGYVATRPDGKTRAELTASSAASGAATTTAAARAPEPTPPANAGRPTPPGVRPSLIPSAFASGGVRPIRPLGQFGVRPGNAGGVTAPTPRRPARPAPQ